MGALLCAKKCVCDYVYIYISILRIHYAVYSYLLLPYLHLSFYTCNAYHTTDLKLDIHLIYICLYVYCV